MDKMREEFEAWINSETGFDCFRTNYPMTKPEDQQYMCHRTNLAWLSWQASRAALRVELPKITDFAIDSREAREVLNFEFAVECVARELNDVGVRHE